MGRKDKPSLRYLKVTLRHVSSPDADVRLSQAIDILLENAARKQNPPAAKDRKHSKEKPSAQISNDDGSGVTKMKAYLEYEEIARLEECATNLRDRFLIRITCFIWDAALPKRSVLQSKILTLPKALLVSNISKSAHIYLARLAIPNSGKTIGFAQAAEPSGNCGS